MKHFFRLTFSLLILLLTLTSCRTAKITATPTLQSLPTATQNAALSDQMNLLATQTQVAALNETAVAVQTTAIPNILPLQSQYTPLPAALLETIGSFQQVSREEALIADRVTGLHAANDGSIFLLSEGGYSVYKDDHWTGFFTDLMGDLIGIDQSGRVWIASQDGTGISAWDGEEWIVYGLNEGWVPVPNPQGNPVSTGIIEDGLGSLWLATDVDVRRFDGRGWQVFSPEDLGMPPMQGEELTSTYTLNLVESRGEVWAGRCDFGGPGPLGGGGVRRFDGQVWHDVGLPVSSACVTTILEDSSGDVWVGADANLYRNRLGSETWDTIALPNPPAELRFGYIATLTPDPAGRLWAALALCGGASCYGGEAYYFLEDDLWNPVGEPSQFGGSRFLFDGSGNSWMLAGSSIYQVNANQLVPVDGLLVQGATTDPSGNLWIVAQSSGPPTLWTLSSGQ